MAIQLRRGNEADLDISRLMPGEAAVCLDSGKIIVKLSGGNYLTLTDTDAIQEIVAGKAPASHSHDDRYYTETEIDNKLGGKSNTGHSHAQSDITGLDSALAGKANTSHTHTKSQIADLANATTSAAGLMSAADKTKLDGINIAVVTQEQYEALNPPDSGTLYLIPEETS